MILKREVSTPLFFSIRVILQFYYNEEKMKNILLLSLTLLWLQFILSPVSLFADEIGYRYYHDMDNEHDGSKYRAYITKKFYKNKLKFAYERKRTGRGIEAGTWFIDHSIKF